MREAVEHATRAITTRIPWFEKTNAKTIAQWGHGQRALAAASDGDEDLARADIASVRAIPDALPETFAAASLAEALLLARHDDRPALAALLARDRRLLLEKTSPRERALVRSLQRMLEARGGSVYREAARREEEQRGELPIASWISAVAPSAAAFAPRTGSTRATIGRIGVEQLQPQALADLAARRASPLPTVRRKRAGRALLLWTFLIVCFLALWQTLQPTPSVRRPTPTAVTETGSLDVAWVLLLPAAFFLIAFPLTMIRQRSLQSRNARAARAFALGDVARALEEYTRLASMVGAAGAQGELALARIADHAGRFKEALTRCDRGIANVAQLKGAGREFVVPQLYAARAHALAACGERALATAQLVQLANEFPAFHALSVTTLSVRMMQAVRASEIEHARALARGRTLDLPLDVRDETLADALVALEERVPEELARLDRELRDDRELGAWMEQVAPAVVEDLRRCAAERRAAI
jgi:hypothetical protein